MHAPALALDAHAALPWQADTAPTFSGDLAATTFFQLLADFSVVHMTGTLRVLPGEGEPSEILVAFSQGIPVAAQLPYECGDLGGGLLPLFFSRRRFCFYEGVDLTDPDAVTTGAIDPEVLVIRAAQLTTPRAVIGGALEEIGDETPIRLTSTAELPALDQWPGADNALYLLRGEPTTLAELEASPVLAGVGIRSLVYALYVLRRLEVVPAARPGPVPIAPVRVPAAIEPPRAEPEAYPLPPPWDRLGREPAASSSPEPPEISGVRPIPARRRETPPEEPVEAQPVRVLEAIAPPPAEPEGGDPLRDYEASILREEAAADESRETLPDHPPADREDKPSRVRVRPKFRVPSPWEVANSVDISFESVDLSVDEATPPEDGADESPLKAVG